MAQSVRKIPLVTRRRRIPDWAIQHVVDQIVQKFSPTKVILFGSYAKGTVRPESDVDLLVVMSTKKEGEESLRIRQAIECPFGLDLIVRSPRTLARRLKMGDYFLREAVNQGKVLYESARR